MTPFSHWSLVDAYLITSQQLLRASELGMRALPAGLPVMQQFMWRRTCHPIWCVQDKLIATGFTWFKRYWAVLASVLASHIKWRGESRKYCVSTMIAGVLIQVLSHSFYITPAGRSIQSFKIWDGCQPPLCLLLLDARICSKQDAGVAFLWWLRHANASHKLFD